MGLNDSQVRREWEKVLANEAACQKERQACLKAGRPLSAHYFNLAKDGAKLKASYEKLKNLGSFNPNNTKHHERMLEQKVTGDLMGRTGADSHLGVNGDKDRRL